MSFTVQSIPEDPEVLYNDALAGIKELDREKATASLEKLKAFPGYETKIQLLEGMIHLSEGRPFKAIKVLEPLSDKKEVRTIAVRTLGNAYAAADNRWKAIEILESLVKEDENEDEARFSLAVLYTQLVAWDEALKHLNILLDRKYRIDNVRSVRAELYTEMDQSKLAIDDITESINANPTSPGNGARAGKVVMLAVEAQDLAAAEKVVDYVDQAQVRGLLEAEKKLKAGDLDQARTMAMDMRKENPLNLPANRVLAKIMVAYGTKEKALEGLALLRMALQGQRNVELYRNVAALARLAEDHEYAGLVQQNVDQLETLNKDFATKLQQTIKTTDDAQLRIELFNLAVETGRIDFALKIVEALEAFYPDRASEFIALRQRLNTDLPQLVNTMSQTDLEKAAAAAIEARKAAGIPSELMPQEGSQTPVPASTTPPAEEKPPTAEEKAPTEGEPKPTDAEKTDASPAEPPK